MQESTIFYIYASDLALRDLRAAADALLRKYGRLDGLTADEEGYRRGSKESVFFRAKSNVFSIYLIGEKGNYSSIGISVGSEQIDPKVKSYTPKACLRTVARFTGWLKTIALTLGNRAQWGIGDSAEAIDAYFFPFSKEKYLESHLPRFWLNYYGHALTAKIGRKTLLETPAYATEAVGDGVLIQTLPLPSLYLPRSYNAHQKMLASESEDWKKLMEYGDTEETHLKKIEEYFLRNWRVATLEEDGKKTDEYLERQYGWSVKPPRNKGGTGRSWLAKFLEKIK